MYASFWDSFRNAFRGVGYAFRTQRNARIHLAIVLLVAIAGILLKVSTQEWAVLVVTISLVLGMEMMNTALETLADTLHPSHNSGIGMAKDVAAGAVVISAAGAVVVGLLIFVPRALFFLRP